MDSEIDTLIKCQQLHPDQLTARIAALEAELAKERDVLADAKLFIEKRREVGFYDGGSRPIDRQNQLDWCNNLLSRIESILTGAAQC